jgi:transcriptional regulator of acetoin/glycerol metabolism
MYDIIEKNEIIKRSHKRSEVYGIEKERKVSKKILSGKDISDNIKNNKELIRVAESFFKSLYHILMGSGFIIVLTDREGCILNLIGDEEIIHAAKELQMTIGAYMDEKSIGTNAMGTAISENSPIQISAAEHFITAYHRWTCSAAPIHGVKGDIIGTLNLTGNSKEVHPHTLGLVIASVNSIENQLRIEAAQAEREMQKVLKLVSKYTGMNARYTFMDLVGQSLEMKRIVEYAKKVADSPSTILIEGESGTGKEVLAQAIHNYSDRRENGFVAINCGAISKTLIESELFGYEEGAFTGAKRGGHPGKFELANGGTLFLDEIGEMPLDMQVNLLRVLQEGYITRVGGNKYISVNVRIIAATNKDLRREVAKGNFRQDLYYRLSVIPLVLPPLRERKEDIVCLVKHFLEAKSIKLNKIIPSMNEAVEEFIYKYGWPGNVRELENFIEKYVNLDGNLSLSVMKEYGFKQELLEEDERVLDKAEKLPGSLENIEEDAIIKTLRFYDNNISKSAKSLGISRNTLYIKLKKYNIRVECF